MSNSSNTQTSAISFLSLLGIVFIVLKLTGVIDWSWWWVTLPLWGGFVLALAILTLAGCAYAIAWWLDRK